MGRSFGSKVVKGRKEKECYMCYSKVGIGEKQEVRKHVDDGEFHETRICVKCKHITDKHYGLIFEDSHFYRGHIKHCMEEWGVDSHEDLDGLLDLYSKRQY